MAGDRPSDAAGHVFYIDQLTRKGELKPGQVKPTDFYTNRFNATAKQ